MAFRDLISLTTANELQRHWNAVFHLFILSLALTCISCNETPELQLNNPSDIESEQYLPKVPLGFNGVMTSDHHAALTWYSLKASQGGFILQRRSKHQAEFTDLASAPKERFQILYDAGDYRENIFTDSLTIPEDSVYVYRIAAYRNSFVSGFSEEVSMKGTIVTGGFNTVLSVTERAENKFK